MSGFQLHLILGNNLENLKRFSYLVKQRTDELLLSSDAKDKNGIALKLLNSVFDFVAVESGKYPQLNRPSHSHELLESSVSIQRRLYYLQYPVNCRNAAKINCNVFKNCGIGCQIHHLVYCLSVSFALNRTLVFENNQQQSETLINWGDFFLPFSSCSTKDYKHAPLQWSLATKDISVIDLPLVEVLNPRPSYLPLAIPESVHDNIKCCHAKPSVWWIGQLVSFIMRPNRRLQKRIKLTEEKHKFKNKMYMACHIRRTDKVGTEAKLHHVYEYNQALFEAHKMLKSSKGFRNISKTVFVATDTFDTVQEFRTDFKFFDIVADEESIDSAAVMKRKAKTSIFKAIVDIFILSKSQYIVCTFSSQFCRLAYELMQSRETMDMSWRVESLDDLYYFGGQNEHFWEAIANHTSKGVNEMSLRIDDKVKVSGDLRNGFMVGTNLRTKREGLFPAYKVEERFETYKDILR
ncbi:alpha-(1,6)-fucosyltransferase-like [Symsagittifera roscoffensis]|uniref:alpha-(1,6)-fucosyltransferase-like n=1 Tax=Symsagittifera roscoffensis TaxID=84072 RepID=UPI00307B2AA2